MELVRKEFVELLTVAGAVLQKYAFNYFIFSDNLITTYNPYAVAIVPFKSELSCAIPADILKFLNKLKCEKITLTMGGNGALEVKGGKAKSTFITLADFQVPTVPEPSWLDPNYTADGYTPEDVKAFVDGLVWAAAFTNKKASEVMYNSVRINDRMSALDDYQIAQTAPHAITFQSEMLVPAEPLKCLSSMGAIADLFVSDGWLVFQDHVGNELYVITTTGDYPPIEDALTFMGDHIEFPESVEEVLDRVSVFLDNPDASEYEVHVDIATSGKAKVTRNALFGSFEESFTMGSVLEPISFVVNPLHLSSGLKVSNKAKHTSGKLLFENETCKLALITG